MFTSQTKQHIVIQFQARNGMLPSEFLLKPSMTTVLPAGCIKRIHVHQHRLAEARKGGANSPWVIQYKGKPYYCTNWSASGELSGVNRMENPLSCGARLFLETTSEVTLQTA